MVVGTGVGTRSVHAAPGSTVLSYDRPARYGMGKDTDQTITMADGVRLRADVYHPTDQQTGQRAPGSFPVLLQQTVYGKQLIQISGNFEEPYWEAKNPKINLPRVVANGVPVFEVGDWHDLFQAGSVRNYTALQNL